MPLVKEFGKKEVDEEGWEYDWDSIPDLIAHARWHIEEDDDPNGFHAATRGTLIYVQKYLEWALQGDTHEDTVFRIKCFLRKYNG